MLSNPEIRLKLKRVKSAIEDIAIKKNLLRGHLDYNKFIILCRSRTGSNLLLNLLQSHQEIKLFHELFNKKDLEQTLWDFPSNNSQDVLNLRRDRPLDFLEQLVFREMPQSISAVGFKLFYCHARQGKMSSVWDWLKENKQIKIIHLKRKNILETYLSQQIALQTNAWFSKGQVEKETIPAITIDGDQLLKAFNQTRQWEQESEAFFNQHSILNICYEDLTNNYVRETQKVQDFLQVNYQFLSVVTKKQATQSIEKQVKNYSELKQKFSHTSWQEFFV